MFDKIRNRMESEEGFTLIELLVVILIIGILAAIAIPSFLNQRYKGQDACAKSMAKQMQTASKTVQTEANTYVGLTLASLTAVETSITGVTTNGNCAPQTGQTGVGGAAAAGAAAGDCTGAPTQQGFCVSAMSVNGNTFSITETGTTGVSRACSIAADGNAGGCKGTAGSARAAGTW